MSRFYGGTYRGIAEGMTFEFRVELSPENMVRKVSGDVWRSSEFIATLVCDQPNLEGGKLSGDVRFRGHPELHSGNLILNIDPRGMGSFHVGVDLEGNNRDVFAGRLDWQGDYMRRLLIEVDGIRGTEPPRAYTGSDGQEMTIERIFQMAGLDVSLMVDPFSGQGTRQQRMRGYTLAEIHAGMLRKRSQSMADRMHVHVFVCSYLEGRANRGVLGIMYDFDQFDINKRPREGVAVFYDHPLLSDPRYPEGLRQREYVFTVVHEIGHALNLLHSFDKARPAALSWMNYPNLYPRGYDAGPNYDGTQQFWRNFKERFDEGELDHLMHATPREIMMGGYAFGVYEEGSSIPFGGKAEPRRTRLGANPLRTTRDMVLEIGALKPVYDLGEPIFLNLSAMNVGQNRLAMPDALDPSEGYVRLSIRTPNGRVLRYRPPVSMCKQAQVVRLSPGDRTDPYSVPLFLGSSGPIFTEPGIYMVAVEMSGVDGSKNVISQPVPIQVRAPDADTDAFAKKLFDKPAVMQALYLRHPISALDEWKELEEEMTGLKLRPDNTTRSYFDYVAGLGWMSPFAQVDAPELPSDLEKATERMKKVDPKGLPVSVRRRVKDMKDPAVNEVLNERMKRPAQVSFYVTPRKVEMARADISPAGLFGSLGLAEAEPQKVTDPFTRIVPRMRGLRRFADIISWNIEHLHAHPEDHQKISKLAELVRSFRCDFWGLQEVGEAALESLVETINSTGQTVYDYVVIEESGQQNGAVFRTDTTTVRELEVPSDFFEEELEVEMSNGQVKKKSVFFRKPLLLDVSVRQGADRQFDFRCAIVHLKSTDSSIKDKGNALRLAAARELARWIEHDRHEGLERDYLVMGDMNAEQAQEGLQDFTSQNDLKLLSVGMQEKYGTNEALTRVASKRMLDHIVVTNDSASLMPVVDEDEQIIIRSDTVIGDWIQQYSDHVPIAVRFVIGEDLD